MKNYFKHIAIILLMFLNMFCSDDKKDTLKPASGFYQKDTVTVSVTDFQVLNLPGRAVISFTPPDSGLLFVKAVYNMSNGEEKSVIADLYENSLVVDGFTDTLFHDIKIYAINRSGVSSSPEIVKVKPLLSSLVEVFNSLDVISYFGGYRLTAKNSLNGIVGITVLQKNDMGQYKEDGDKSIFTSQDSILSVVTDLDASKTYQFGFYVIDQFGNTSDTMYKIIDPLLAVEIDRSAWTIVDYDDDIQGGPTDWHNEALVSHLIDGNPDTYWLTTWDHEVPHPHYVTIDMGTEHLISGFKVWGRISQHRGNPEVVTFMLGNDENLEKWDFQETFTLTSDIDDLHNQVSLSKAVRARYFKFKVDKSFNNEWFTHVAEVWAMGN